MVVTLQTRHGERCELEHRWYMRSAASLDEMRDGDTFAAEAVAPSEATTLERIVAFSGREIHGNTTN
jgi:hypothetical protein